METIKTANVRVCFGCKQYTHIFPDNPQNLGFINLFNIWHLNHTLQTINLGEIDTSYTLINENKRQKAIEEILPKKNLIINSFKLPGKEISDLSIREKTILKLILIKEVI